MLDFGKRIIKYQQTKHRVHQQNQTIDYSFYGVIFLKNVYLVIHVGDRFKLDKQISPFCIHTF